jgi:hypothetical protein
MTRIAQELRAAVRQIIHRELGFDVVAHVGRSAEVRAFEIPTHRETPAYAAMRNASIDRMQGRA